MCFVLKGDHASAVKTRVTRGGAPNSPYLPTTATATSPK